MPTRTAYAGGEYERSTAYASHSKALACFRQALEQDPNCAAAYCGLAVCYVSAGKTTPQEDERRHQEALGHVQRAVELDPLNAQGHWLLGMFHQCSDETQLLASPRPSNDA